MSVPESKEVKEEGWWRRGANFHWCWPKFDFLHAADPITKLMFNRYPHNIIGVALYVKGRGVGIRWKSS